jgi:branched-chain amino acid transport system substrate-binding protein
VGRGGLTALVVLALGSVVGAAACSDTDAAPSSSIASPPPDTIADRASDGVLRLAVLLPADEASGGIGGTIETAVRLAVDDVNEGGGVLGEPVEIVAVLDEGGDAASAGSAARAAIDAGADAVIGATGNVQTIAALQELVPAGIAACSPAAAGLSVSDFPDSGLFFRTVAADRLQAAALADLVGRSGARTAAVLVSDDDYGRTITSALDEFLATDGTNIVAEVLYASGGDAVQAVDDLLAPDPDAIVVVADAAGAAPVLGELVARGRGPQRTPLVLSDAMRTAELPALVDGAEPGALSGAIGAAVTQTPVERSAFAVRWEDEAAGREPSYAAQASDCATLLALAAEASASDAAMDFSGQMVPLTRGGMSCERYAECIRLLSAGRNVAFAGGAGPLELDDAGDPTVGRFDVYRFTSRGEIVTTDSLTVVQD